MFNKALRDKVDQLDGYIANNLRNIKILWDNNAHNERQIKELNKRLEYLEICLNVDGKVGGSVPLQPGQREIKPERKCYCAYMQSMSAPAIQSAKVNPFTCNTCKPKPPAVIVYNKDCGYCMENLQYFQQNYGCQNKE